MASLNDDPGARVAAISGLRGAYEPGDYSTGSAYLPQGGVSMEQYRNSIPSIYDFLGVSSPDYTWDSSNPFLGIDQLRQGISKQNELDYINSFGAWDQNKLDSLGLSDQGWWTAYDPFGAEAMSASQGGRYANMGLYTPMGLAPGLVQLRKNVDGGEIYGNFNRQGQLVGNTTFERDNDSNFWDMVKGVAPSALAMFGGAIPGLSTMFGAGTLGQMGAGALMGGLGSAISGGDIFKGALGGAVGGGITSGLNSTLPDVFSGISSDTIKRLSSLGGNIGKQLATGGDVNGMFLASQAPRLAGIFDKGPTNMDDFNVPGGMSIPGGGTQIPSWAQPSGYEAPVSGPMSTSQPYLESSGGLSDLYNFGGSGFAPTEGGLGEYTPADYTLSVPQSQSSGPFSGTSDVTAGPSQDPEWQKFLSSPQGRLIMQIMGRANPTLGAVGGMAASVLGGGNGQRMGPWQAGAGALASLYGYNRANSALKQQQRGLQSLFSPNSAYAKQMEQTLARKDAAAGRRSQYGPREVELQARLAELNSRNAPQIAQLSAARDSNRQRMMMDMLGLGLQSGAIGKLGSSLEDLYNSF